MLRYFTDGEFYVSTTNDTPPEGYTEITEAEYAEGTAMRPSMVHPDLQAELDQRDAEGQEAALAVFLGARLVLGVPAATALARTVFPRFDPPADDL